MNTYETDTQLKNYKLPQGKTEIWLKDKKTENLYCIVRQNTKRFYYKYKTNGKEKKIPIGKYPSFSLSEARLKALEYQTARDRGENIQSAKIKALTFGEIASEYIDKKKSELRPEQMQDFKRSTQLGKNIGRIEKHIYPSIKERKTSEIKRTEIIEAIEKIQDHEVKNGLTFETSRRTFNFTKEIFKYAVSRGYIEYNPLSEVEFKDAFKTQKRDKHFKAITDTKRLSEFVKAIYSDTSIRFQTINALKFGLHTGLRTKNIRLLKWEYIDFSKNLITIPSPNMKTNKDKDSFKLPISRQVKAILLEMQTRKKGEYVFYSDIARSKAINENAINQAIKWLGFGDEMHGHGLRSVFSTTANANTKEHGLNSDIIELSLDHTLKDRIKAIYDRNLYLSERAELMQWYSDYLESLAKC
ncbi:MULTISPECIES: tyrosine-type recombinase/integrase [unclassified Campylobacter]|uniref:tyrosine-type recombinase/integrase n=1 Tax=unclassified Campylobacter TaxID=2593542 RepID=UPI0022E9F110|nr:MULTISPECIES: site-specific integrase [unclassified Campylobacter]MDA3062839.1 site-specific integrase [Campylobacter sp. JMF_14 EL1]MDA3073733.1 site-specific integrase [Campylobacter sp. JMF_10 EL2]